MLKKSLQFLNKHIWATGAVCFCFAMVSGQMWNKMRRAQLFQRTEKGSKYISGPRKQFVYESYMVAILNAAVVVGMILMIEAAGGARPNVIRTYGKWRLRFQWVVGLVLVCVFFSMLLSIFKMKFRGYRYSFLFN